MRFWLGGLALLAAESASAACSAPYSTDSLLADMVVVESGMRGGKTTEAMAAAKKLEAGLPCLDEVLPSMIAGRTYRAIAGGYVVGGDVARGGEWFTTASEIESGFDYGLEDLPATHPVRDAWSTARQTPPSDPVFVDGRSWVTGKIYLDGRNQAGNTPGARPNRPHLVQLNDGTSVKGWLIQGGAIPAELLGTPAAPAVLVAGGKPPKEPKPAKEPKAPKPVPVVAAAPEPAPAVAPVVPAPPPPPVAPAPTEVAAAPKPAPAPKPEKAPKPEPVAEPEPAVADADPVEEAPKEPKVEKEPKAAKEKPAPELTSSGAFVIDRQRPWEKTPLMIGGGVLCAGAAVLYWQALGHKDDFLNSPEVDTTKEVLAEQSAANTFTLASSTVLAVGVGTLTWGVILDGGNFHVPVLNLRW